MRVVATTLAIEWAGPSVITDQLMASTSSIRRSAMVRSGMEFPVPVGLTTMSRTVPSWVHTTLLTGAWDLGYGTGLSLASLLGSRLTAKRRSGGPGAR